MATETALAVVNAQNAVQIFTGGLDALLAEIEGKVRAIPLDPSTVAGREKIRSTAYQVVRTKTALDAEGKKLTEDWRQKTALVNAERKKSSERLDALAEEIRAPLTAFEEKEKARVAAHELAVAELAGLRAMVSSHPNMTATQLREHLEDYRTLHIGRAWEEFEQRANATRIETIDFMNARIAAAEKYEADQAELARLRKEAEERERAEREAKIAAKAAEDARLAAERKAKEEADAEAKRVIEAAKAEERRVASEADRLAKEAQAKIDAEKAARLADQQKAEAEARKRAAEIEQARREREAAEEALRLSQEKAESDRIAAEAKRKVDVELAAKRERERIEAKRKADEDARLKREADEKLRAKVKSEIIADLVALFHDEFDRPDDLADALMSGKIRNVKVTY